MNEMVRVINAGLQTMVVDLGRHGWYWHGLPPSGPMDRFSYLAGNILLGNDENAASLECCYTCPSLEIMSDTCVVFTGVELQPMINDEAIPMWQVHGVKQGDVISFGGSQGGKWAYLSFSGGIDVPVVYGSRTTYLPGHLGGFEGRALRKGDILGLLPPTTHFSRVVGTRLQNAYVPHFSDYNEVRVVFGLQEHFVTNKDEWSEAIWELSTMDSRIGYRFYTKEFAYRWARQPGTQPRRLSVAQNPCDTIIVPCPLGSIQTNIRNEATVVLQDTISVTGFVSVGSVIQSDLDTLAQAKPGDTVKFMPISYEQAVDARRARYALLNRIRESCLRLPRSEGLRNPGPRQE